MHQKENILHRLFYNNQENHIIFDAIDESDSDLYSYIPSNNISHHEYQHSIPLDTDSRRRECSI